MVKAKKQRRSLNVLMNGVLIGKLEKLISGALVFEYEQAWLNTPDARPISLSLPLAGKKFDGDVVYDFFDNLLPDNKKIRERIKCANCTNRDWSWA